jgi:hypothetical protein
MENKIASSTNILSTEQPVVKTEEQVSSTTNKKSNKNAKNNKTSTEKAVRSSSRKESQMDLSEPTPATPPVVAVSSPSYSKDENNVENKSENFKSANVKATTSDCSIFVKTKLEENESKFKQKLNLFFGEQ